MRDRKQLKSKARKLSTQEAKRVARNLQSTTIYSVSRTKTMKPLSLKSTATGKGAVVFRASRVLNSFVRAAKI